VDTRSEIRQFLTSRRAKITPDQAGLRVYGDNRRVPGLRREEVALLAGVSVDYYTRLERGSMSGVSESVLDALARALQLDDAERSHLFDLARASQGATPRRRRAKRERIRPGVQRVLDAMTGAPAFVRNGRLDILGANQLGYALYSVYASPLEPANTARFAFLDRRAKDFYLDWDRVTDEVVAILRSEAGRAPYDRNLSDLVGELSTQSEAFRKKWAAHNVRFHDTGVKRVHHPLVGDLELTYEAMELAADGGLTMFAYTAEPGSKTEEGLNLLASWSGTPAEPTPPGRPTEADVPGLLPARL
jgi:transcriptional regulator with XRE-family HTH domain